MPEIHKRHVPVYRLHRASGQAIVTINGRDHYLGPHGSEASKIEYDRLIAEWLANDRNVPGKPESQVKLKHIILAYWDFVQTYYRKADGTPTSEVNNIQQVLKLLRRLYSNTLTCEFGPRALKTLQQEMITLGWCRKSINKQVDRIRRMFKWAASEEKLPVVIYDSLRTVAPLRRGRTTARENPPVTQVPEEYIQAIQPFVSRQVWALICLQLLTGAREGELLKLRGVDLQTEGKIWTARPDQHKTAWRGKTKTIYFGPQAQTVLQEFLANRPVNAYLFSPQEAEAERQAVRHARRKTPVQYGNRPGTNRKESPQRRPMDHYIPVSYGRAITRACDLAFPPPDHLVRKRIPGIRGKSGSRWEPMADWRARLGPERWSELNAWWKAHRWHPHQLRHNAGTYIRREFGLEVSRAVLGHSSMAVTEIYAEQDAAKAMEAMSKIG